MISAPLPFPSLLFPRSRFLGAILIVLVGGLAAPRETAAQPTVEYALGLSPRQKNVDYTKLTPEEAKSATLKMEKEGSVNAMVVRGPRGDVLRSFADTNGDRTVDRWSYYKDGLEVYRDVDSDFNSKPDSTAG